ncbi:hypothetical protein GMLC_21670 [Geomonas limicola]|uniref:Uncharacterized protein n=1 Tax=Geomonas limicola TaxID=2740186 RepID=A0A6V8N7Q4_9BACT|nr:hypothetical protein [Geomonas limicola]GFO68588.1 hypothetical protein GMLC_21670 [Geomonas limicola]
MQAKVRICSLSGDHFKVCCKHKLWGANSFAPKSWAVGDILVFKVDNELAGVARVAGTAYMDDTPIWDNGLFFYRVKLKFDKILNVRERIPFDGEVKACFVEKWGRNWGWVLQNKYPLPADVAEVVLKKMGI